MAPLGSKKNNRRLKQAFSFSTHFFIISYPFKKWAQHSRNQCPMLGWDKKEITG